MSSSICCVWPIYAPVDEWSSLIPRTGFTTSCRISSTGDVVKVALRNWVHDLPAMAEAQADIAFICNPHNPTGTVVPAEAVKAFIDQSSSTLTIVDEAYIDFVENVDRQSALPLAREGRLVVLRTFSKIMGMAGLRIGFMVASAEVVEVLRRVRPPFSVNSLAQAAGRNSRT